MIDSPSRNPLAVVANRYRGLYRRGAQRKNELSRTFQSSYEIAFTTRAGRACEGCAQGFGGACLQQHPFGGKLTARFRHSSLLQLIQTQLAD
ncbi:hypothetical protein [Paraburkholderia dilworthii]|uniref:hypothetical protein n=1 Tax=Paraburkholderia dilworthii TaxID=948106 RepID=UPI000482B2D9|nr:hypothetical protein [Paraburkholderia dilworthii]